MPARATPSIIDVQMIGSGHHHGLTHRVQTAKMIVKEPVTAIPNHNALRLASGLSDTSRKRSGSRSICGMGQKMRLPLPSNKRCPA